MSFSANTIATAGAGTFVGGVFSDTYNASSSNDVEMVALDLVAGRLYEVDGDGTAGDAYVRIFDRFGNEVKAIDDDFDNGEAFSNDFYTQFIPNYTGRYYLAVSNAYLTEYDPDTTAGRPTVDNPGPFAAGTLVVTDTGLNAFPASNAINSIAFKASSDESDVVETADRGIPVEYGANAFITANDVEMGRFDLLKGDTVVIDLNGQVNANTSWIPSCASSMPPAHRSPSTATPATGATANSSSSRRTAEASTSASAAGTRPTTPWTAPERWPAAAASSSSSSTAMPTWSARASPTPSLASTTPMTWSASPAPTR